jgi:hypothetical protein
LDVVLICRVLHENPEVALVGSCVLVMLMKDEDVYIMNVGDSRAIIAQDRRHASFSSLSRFSHVQPQTDSPTLDEQNRIGARDTLLRQELERIIEETPTELEALESSHDATSLVPPPPGSLLLSALQLSSDHSTSIPEVDAHVSLWTLLNFLSSHETSECHCLHLGLSRWTLELKTCLWSICRKWRG